MKPAVAYILFSTLCFVYIQLPLVKAELEDHPVIYGIAVAMQELEATMSNLTSFLSNPWFEILPSLKSIRTTTDFSDEPSYTPHALSDLPVISQLSQYQPLARSPRDVQMLECPNELPPYNISLCPSEPLGCRITSLSCDGDTVDSVTDVRGCLVKKMECKATTELNETIRTVMSYSHGLLPGIFVCPSLVNVSDTGYVFASDPRIDTTKCTLLSGMNLATNEGLTFESFSSQERRHGDACTIDTVSCRDEETGEMEVVNATKYLGDLQGCSIVRMPCREHAEEVHTCTALFPSFNETSSLFSLNEVSCDGGQVCQRQQCVCPMDKMGKSCTQYRPFTCSLLLLSPKLDCPEVEEGLDSDPPCIQVKMKDELKFKYVLSCKFATKLTAQEKMDGSHFSYYAKNSTNFGLSEIPEPLFQFQLRAFNFNRMGDKNGTLTHKVNGLQSGGQEAISFKLSPSSYDKGYFSGGRLYLEASLSSFPPGLRYTPYRRTFIDIKDYKFTLPPVPILSRLLSLLIYAVPVFGLLSFCTWAICLKYLKIHKPRKAKRNK